MLKSSKPPRKRGDTRIASGPRPKASPRHNANPRGGYAKYTSQTRGGRPPRIPGRTGGR